MKKLKRDPLSRAFTRGYKAGCDEKSRSSCPHDTGEPRQYWLSGWREGREDHWNGFNKQAQMQRISNM